MAILSKNLSRETTLYYDGVCSLCSKEIRILQSICDDNLYLRNIHSLSAEKTEGLPSKAMLLLYLHAQTEKGDWLVGLDATVRAWQHTPYGKFFKILGIPGFRLIADYCYNIWAKRRYERNMSGGLYDACSLGESFHHIDSDRRS